MKFRPPTVDASSAFALTHMISHNAGQADHFQKLPGLMARALQVPAVSLMLVRCLIATPEVLAEGSYPEAAPSAEALAWCAGAIPQLSFGGRELQAADRVVGGTRQHWAVSAVSGQVYLLAQFELTGEMHDLIPLIDSLVEYAARVVGASLFWHENPAGLGEPLNRLTLREWEVLKAIHCADPEKIIAERLRVSPHTFHVHIKKIYRKLDVRSRLSLIELCRGVENERLVGAVSLPAVQWSERALCPA